MSLEQQLSILSQNQYSAVLNLGPTLNLEITKQEGMQPEALLVLPGSISYYALPLTNNKIPTFFHIKESANFNGNTNEYINARLSVIESLGNSLHEIQLCEYETDYNTQVNAENFNNIKKRAKNPLAVFLGSINEETFNDLERKYLGWRLLEVLTENYSHHLRNDAIYVDNLINIPGYHLFVPEHEGAPQISMHPDLADNIREAADIYLRISSYAYNEAQRTSNRYQELSGIYHRTRSDFTSQLKILEERIFNYLKLQVLAAK